MGDRWTRSVVTTPPWPEWSLRPPACSACSFSSTPASIPLVLTGQTAVIMTTVAALSAVALLLTAWRTWRRPVSHADAHAVTAAMGAVLATNALLHLALTQQARQTSNVMLAVVALAAALLETRWAVSLVTVTIAAWGLSSPRLVCSTSR